MIKPINQKAFEARRSVTLNPASLPTIKSGQVVATDANGYGVLADGAGVIGDPMWAISDTTRLDTIAAESISVIEAPFTALVGADGYTGTPAKGDALVLGTGANVGKLETKVLSTVADLQAVVAYCVAPPDADNNLKIKAIR